MRDDDEAQVDGDAQPAASPFATRMRASPWLHGGPSPWHLWGNTQVIDVPATPVVTLQRVFPATTLVRVAYGRPETWHYQVSVTLLDAPGVPVGPPNLAASLTCLIEIMTGVGRSVMKFSLGLPQFLWSPGAAVPVGESIWLNQHETGVVQIDRPDPVPPAPGDYPERVRRSLYADRFVAQDVTIVARPHFQMPILPAAGARIEVSCQLAPATHIRPDWYQRGAQASEQFAGEETGGR